MRFAELGAMAFIENENDLLLIDRQIVFALHQVVQLLNRGDDNLVVVFFDIAF